MKIISIDVFSCEGGWRTLNFIKIQTDEGITGYAECNCVRSDAVLRAAIGYLGPLVIGRNPFQTEKIQFELYKTTQRQLGGAMHQAISGLTRLCSILRARRSGCRYTSSSEGRSTLRSGPITRTAGGLSPIIPRCRRSSRMPISQRAPTISGGWGSATSR